MDVTVSVLRRNKCALAHAAARIPSSKSRPRANRIVASMESQSFQRPQRSDLRSDSTRQLHSRQRARAAPSSRFSQVSQVSPTVIKPRQDTKKSLDRAISSIDVTRDVRACLPVIKKAAIATSAYHRRYRRRQLSTVTARRNVNRSLVNLARPDRSSTKRSVSTLRFIGAHVPDQYPPSPPPPPRRDRA